ncbi:hypothetical protein GL213_06210 [Halogeometricum borinquense]|uniref:Uncharacterized protein n=1 Tax=Halogeometricum borinquense TaxID=60847 RepID=A0A6C0UH34_9EURY|nr:hypothetical protein [Halogeometricum borinquense]QIB74854.1 hypothetical protein G3I44_11535 [Halogeometricum borinquense]QIQ76148.1 hypothetical protein GL213_06210 [Halogeometricum borinquense]
MVGPSLSGEERTAASMRLKIGFVLLVAASGALVAVQADGSLAHIAGGFVGGLLLGIILTYLLVHWWSDFVATTNRGRR